MEIDQSKFSNNEKKNGLSEAETACVGTLYET